jgi:polyisoprenyl-phosphate glycosyltransferase
MEEFKQPELSVIIPVFNEEFAIRELFSRLCKSLSGITENFEILFINDGSRDSTLAELKTIAALDSRVKFLSLSRNFGHQVAIAAGIDLCKGNIAVIMDGDLQDPPELIPGLYAKFKEGYNVVYAKRTRRAGESGIKKITAHAYYRILKSITSIDIPVDTGDFRLIDKKVIQSLRQMPEKNKFFRGQVAWLGFRQTYVDYERSERSGGRSGYSFGKMTRFAFDGITGFSDIPLRIASTLGFVVSFVAFIIIIYALISHFILRKTITGWTSIIISTMFIGGIQLITIGIIGEYISRMNNDLRNRPLYIIEETNLNTPEI